MYKTIAAMAALALLFAPLVAAEHAEDESLLGAEGIYVADNGLWEESNDHSGLQRAETQDGDEIVPADTEILTV